MKLLIQRVAEASVSIDGETVGAIGPGLLALVGCREGDTPEDADRLAVRAAALRIFPEDAGRMNRSVADIGGSVLAVSQFTLYADTRKGNRPSFVHAGDPAKAAILCDRFAADLRSLLGPDRVAEGRFGADMRVALVNDGPCTLELISETASAPAASPRPRIPLPALELLPVDTDERAARAKAVAEAAWPETYRGLIPDAQIPYMISRMYDPETIRRETAEGSPFYLLLADGRDAGICSFDLSKRGDRGSAELHKIYLLPAYWSRGIGAWLLAEMAERARAAGAATLWLRVNKGNRRAQKAYKAAGFANVRAVCTDIGGGFVMDDYVFARRLAP